MNLTKEEIIEIGKQFNVHPGYAELVAEAYVKNKDMKISFTVDYGDKE